MVKDIKFRTKSESFIMNAPAYLGGFLAAVLFIGAPIAGHNERIARYSMNSRASCSTNSVESILDVKVNCDPGNYDFRNRVPERFYQK